MVDDVEILEEELPVPLIEGLLGRGELVGVYGAPESCKTFLCLDWSFHVGRGLGDWQGLAADRGEVIYVAGEGHSGLARRVEAWKRYHGLSGQDYCGVRLVRQVVPLHREEYLQAFLDQFCSQSDNMPALIVFDTLASHLNGGVENASEGMGAFVSNASRLVQETGATVVLVHHANNGGAPRGHSSFRGSVDREIKVNNLGEDRISLNTQKNRNDPDHGSLSVRLVPFELGTTESDKPVTSLVIADNSATPRKRKQAENGGQKDGRAVKPARINEPQLLSETAMTLARILYDHKEHGIKSGDWEKEWAAQTGLRRTEFNRDRRTVIGFGLARKGDGHTAPYFPADDGTMWDKLAQIRNDPN